MTNEISWSGLTHGRDQVARQRAEADLRDAIAAVREATADARDRQADERAAHGMHQTEPGHRGESPDPQLLDRSPGSVELTWPEAPVGVVERSGATSDEWAAE